MSLSEIIVLVGFVLEVATLVAAAVWAVAKIRGPTTELSVSIKSLTRTVGRLETVVERIDGKVDGHGEKLAGHSVRISALESRGR